MPPVPWEVPIDMHYALLIDNYDSAARKAFVPKKQNKYKPYFSKDTINLVQARKTISALLDCVPVVISPDDMVFFSELVSIVLHNVINTFVLSDQVTAFVYNVAFCLSMINMDVTVASPTTIFDIIKFTRLSLLKFISYAANNDKKIFLQSKTDCSTDARVSAREQWQAINLVLKFGGRKPTQFAKGAQSPEEVEGRWNICHHSYRDCRSRLQALCKSRVCSHHQHGRVGNAAQPPPHAFRYCPAFHPWCSLSSSSSRFDFKCPGQSQPRARRYDPRLDDH